LFLKQPTKEKRKRNESEIYLCLDFGINESELKFFLKDFALSLVLAAAAAEPT
jgi:hypothetical protein